MNAHRLLTAFLFASAFGSLGCASLFGGGSSSTTDDDGEAYRGTVTVENRSGAHICSITTMQNGTGTETIVSLEPGGTATFEAAGDVYRLQLTQCETNVLLYGDPLAWINDRELVPGQQLRVGRLIVLDAASAPVEEPGAVSISLYPHEPGEALRDTFIATMMRNVDDGTPFMEDQALAEELLTMLQRGARAQGWTESFEAAVIALPEWRIVQEERQYGQMVTIARDLQFVAGARWPDGHCSAQSFGARQPFDGDSPQGAVGFNGIGDQLVIPCALLEEMKRSPNVATGG